MFILFPSHKIESDVLLSGLEGLCKILPRVFNGGFRRCILDYGMVLTTGYTPWVPGLVSRIARYFYISSLGVIIFLMHVGAGAVDRRCI